jgi:hypothetical protein
VKNTGRMAEVECLEACFPPLFKTEEVHSLEEGPEVHQLKTTLILNMECSRISSSTRIMRTRAFSAECKSFNLWLNFY